MPLPVRSRRYDDTFWEELLGKDRDKRTTASVLEDLGFN
jgi:hypothetical protein